MSDTQMLDDLDGVDGLRAERYRNSWTVDLLGPRGGLRSRGYGATLSAALTRAIVGLKPRRVPRAAAPARPRPRAL